MSISCKAVSWNSFKDLEALISESSNWIRSVWKKYSSKIFLSISALPQNNREKPKSTGLENTSLIAKLKFSDEEIDEVFSKEPDEIMEQTAFATEDCEK